MNWALRPRPVLRPSALLALVMLHADAAPGSASDADAQDVRRSLDGDGEAFARIVGRYQQRVAAHVWPFVRDGARAEEVVHDTFVEAYLSLASYRGQSALPTWLCAIATRVVYRGMRDRDRRTRRDAAFAREHERAHAPARAPTDERAERLWALVDTLPAPDRLVLTMMYAHGRSTAEIGAMTGWSSVLVKVRAFRARNKLRVLLEESNIK